MQSSVSPLRRLHSFDEEPIVDPTPQVRAALERLRAGYRQEPYPSLEARLERLAKLRTIVKRQQNAITTALRNDYGTRSPHETRMVEILAVVSQIKHIEANLKAWMRSEPRKLALHFRPATAKVMSQPLGVVGVIASWTFPFQSALGPLASAIAAGNRVLIKPSENAPASAELIQRMVREIYDTQLAEVLTGGPETGEALARMPLDHLFFTGAATIARQVGRIAGANLTPLTLELGGKSPAIVHPSYSLAKAAERIAYGKLFNAGQSCLAPDYVLVHETQAEPLAHAIAKQTRAMYPKLAGNVDYAAIINDRAHDRLTNLIHDAEQRGAQVLVAKPDDETLDIRSRTIAPTILLRVTDDMLVMQEEIMGPVLPIVTYRDLDQALSYVQERPRPFALYYFDSDEDRQRDVLRRCPSGGACINDCMLHPLHDDLPLGGVGPSGMGRYRGHEGFDTFSHKRSVFMQARINPGRFLLPPYGERIDKLLKMLLG